MKVSGIITLTTDFGLSDPYVGIMKGVILSINPEAQVIDICHQIKAGAIIHAAGIIEEAYSFFPKGSIHVAVVDPGVGGDRRPILLKTENHLFVGPDNGLFWPIIKACNYRRIIHLTQTKYFLPELSHTFHGRDIFAPAAAYLSNGIDPLKMGPTISDPVPLRQKTPQQEGGVLVGQVIRVDHFGNLITNVHRKDLEQLSGKARPVIKVGNLTIEGVHQTYSAVGEGEILALIGSSGFLEIAVHLGRACDHLRLEPEDIVGAELEVSRSC